MCRRGARASVCVVFLLGSSSAGAHHNAVATYDLNSEIVHENVTVVAWRFANPHAHLVFEAPDADGVMTQWRASTSSLPSLRRNGYTRDTFLPGQIITIKGPPGRDNRPVMAIDEVILSDGTVIKIDEPAPATVYSAASVAAAGKTENPLAGYWEFVRGPISDEARALAPEDTYFLHAFGQVTEDDEDESGGMPLTEKGKAFQLNWKDTDDECVAISGWMGFIAPYLVEFEQPHNGRIRINYQYMDLERTVWLDGRSFPDVGRTPRTPSGYSVGYWEGDTLVVETRNMHSNLVTRNGIHHSENAVIKEWFSREGDTLTIVRLLEDPDRFTRPIGSVVQRRLAADTEIAPWGDCVPSL